MSTNLQHRIFFYCYPPSPPHKAAFQHSIICLAEGFKELGIPFYSDRNYWQLYPGEDKYLFRHDPDVTPDDCSIVIVNNQWMDYGKGLPENLFNCKRHYKTVYIDAADGNFTASWHPEFRQFDLILKCHFNKKIKYPPNLRAWAFGISNRILDYTNHSRLFRGREKSILFNCRINHGVRELAKKTFLPAISDILLVDNSIDRFNPPQLNEKELLWWNQTGRRHYPTYYNRLKASAACACFGGYLEQPWLHKNHYITKQLNRILNKLFPQLLPMVLQWDSWRFWESLAAGCVAFHVDFEKYGLQLPVMPLNYQHYIGIDFNNPNAAITKLANNPEILAMISEEGRFWAIENYSPVPTAERFLDMIESR